MFEGGGGLDLNGGMLISTLSIEFITERLLNNLYENLGFFF